MGYSPGEPVAISLAIEREAADHMGLESEKNQVLGAPAWTSQERFEVQATTGRPSSVDEERLMVQRLLAASRRHRPMGPSGAPSDRRSSRSSVNVGVRLDSQRAPVDILLIDFVDHPIDN
jgi:hypothetical protein